MARSAGTPAGSDPRSPDENCTLTDARLEATEPSSRRRLLRPWRTLWRRLGVRRGDALEAVVPVPTRSRDCKPLEAAARVHVVPFLSEFKEASPPHPLHWSRFWKLTREGHMCIK